MVSRRIQSWFPALDTGRESREVRIALAPPIGLLVRRLGVTLATLVLIIRCLVCEPADSSAVPSVLRDETLVAWTLAFSAEGSTVFASGLDTRATSWNTGTGDVQASLLCRKGGCVRAILAPGGQTLAAEDCASGVTLWDTSTGKKRAQLPALSGRDHALTFSADGETLASADESAIRLWDARTGRLRAQAQPGLGGITRVALAPDGRTLALGSVDGLIEIRDLRCAEPLALFRAHRGPVSTLAFTADSRLIGSASTAEKVARLWAVAGGRHIADLRGHSRVVQSAAFAPDARSFATAGADGTVRLWEVSTGRLLCILSGSDVPLTALAFSPDGRALAAGGAGLIWFWNVGETSRSTMK